jgi:4-amino-4-deoxy-L-arabinose transferase-like glycosyltransferase
MIAKRQTMQNQATHWFLKNWQKIALGLLLLFAFLLRMIDLTDAPLDFHPSRQFRGALIARSLYFELVPSTDAAIQSQMIALRGSVAELEPPILESIIAISYWLTGGEQLWIARIVNSLLWIVGAIALFALAKKVSSRPAALIALAYYLFLPFGVLASRSFQPDPFMVTWLAIAAYAGIQWTEARNWKWAIATGLATGFALLIKAVAAYFLGGMLIALVLNEFGLKRALRDAQTWVIFTFSLFPSSIYYLLNIGERSQDFFQNWVVALLPLAFEAGFYVRWLSFIGDIFGLAIILLALIGIIFAHGRYRWMLVGLWSGYLIYGISLPHQTLTHNYYHLPVLLIIALSLPPVIQLLIREISARSKAWQVAFALVILSAIAFNAWIGRNELVAEDHRGEAHYWQAVGEALPPNGQIVGLVQHYGNLLNYYGQRNIDLWPVTAELQLAELRGNDSSDFEAIFLKRTDGADYFLVTTFNQLNQQSQLSERLYSQYSIWDEGDGYIIFDLRVPFSSSQ